MFTDWLRSTFRGVIDAAASIFNRLGLHPNTLTIVGCLLQLGVGVVLASGALRLGGVLLALASAFDALDGALARQLGKTSRFGAFLDSSLDRISESGILLGLAWFYMGQPGRTEEIIIYIAIVGSLMVSYTRARAEGLGIECKEGLFTRVERTLVLFIGLVTGWVVPALWILAVGSLATAVHRMISVYLKVRDEPLVP
jgi:CDP-diacylglycerol---glycerol-3-phosphate 3-phosphatidyltransferase